MRPLMPPMVLLALVALVALTTAGCGVRGRLHVFPSCADGLPVQILTDPRCPPDGICGYSCLPDRWTKEGA